jgi:hypothetical protein
VVEVLLAQVGVDAAQVEGEGLLESAALLLGQITHAFEQAPAGVLEERLLALSAQLTGLVASDLFEGLVQTRHDRERAKNLQGLGGPLGDDGPIGLPHVRAHERAPCGRGLAESVEEPMQGRLGALFSDP